MNQPLKLDLDKPEDQAVALGHLLSLADKGEIGMDELDAMREKLIDLAETLSCKLEDTVMADVEAGLSERDRKKARHRFLGQCKNLESKLRKLLHQVEHFQVHSY